MRNHNPTLRQILAVALTGGLLLVTGVTAGPALGQEGPPSGFPSWEDVQAAKGNEAATAAEVSKIGGLLDSLENEATSLSESAVGAGATLALTQRKLNAAVAEVDVLNAQANRASVDAAKYKKDAVAVAVQSYKNGGTGLGLFASVAALESPESLNGVELMQQVGEKAARKQTKALESQAAATALEKTRKAAQEVQAFLTTEARAASDAAVAAHSAVVTQLNAKEEQSATLTAQLASLNNTTVAKEAQYRQGQEAQAAYYQAQEAKRQAAETAEALRRAEAEREAARHPHKPSRPQVVPNPVVPPANPAPGPAKPAPKPVPANPVPNPVPAKPVPGGGYIPVEVLLPNIPGGAVNDPAGAKAYASSRMGGFGWAQSEFNCLNLLWERESNWRTNATNPYSGAYGIAQALPPGKYAAAGSDWLSNYRTQIEWGLGYIKNRYGSPCGAWNHSQSVGWY